MLALPRVSLVMCGVAVTERSNFTFTFTGSVEMIGARDYHDTERGRCRYIDAATRPTRRRWRRGRTRL